MIDKIADAFVEKQLRTGILPKEDANVYRYGYKMVMELIINIIIAISIGIITGELLTVTFFLMMFIPLRSYCGGYHASKTWRCVLLSNLVIVAVIWVEKYVPFHMGIIHVVIFENLCSGIMILLAPVQSVNKPLSHMEIKAYKKRAVVILIFQLVLESCFMLCNVERLVRIMMMVHALQALILIYGVRSNSKLKMN